MPFALAADLQQIAKRFGSRLGDDDDAEHELLPDLQFGAGVHAAQRLAGFKRLFEMGHAVPQRQRDVAKVTDIRRFPLSLKKPPPSASENIFPPVFRSSPNAGKLSSTMRVARASVPACCAKYLLRLETFVNQRKKIVLDRGVEDLTVGEIAEDAHQRTRREIL